jgi:hypothetical protein
MNDTSHICLICNQILTNTCLFVKHLKKDHNITSEYYYIHHLNNPIPVCANCKGPVEFNRLSKGYKKHCSIKCGHDNPNIKKIRAENHVKSLQEKYGVSNSSQIPGSRDKVRKTKLERYGDENYTNPKKNLETNLRNHNGQHSNSTVEVNERRKKKMLETIGVDHHTKLQSFKDKVIEQTRQKYGVNHNLQRPDIRKRIADTNNLKYGGTLKGSPMMRERIKNTMIERYGFEHTQQSEELKLKTRNTNIERYGKPSPLQNPNILMPKYGVTDINQLDWVVEKQKENRIKTLKNRYNVTNSYNVRNHRDKIRETLLRKYDVINPMQVKEFFNKMLRNKKGAFKLRSFVHKDNIINYQSKVELKFIEFCITNNIEIYNGDIIKYIGLGNIPRRYYVDFKVLDGDKYRLIEIKDNHIWYRKAIENGSFNLKCNAAIKYSIDNNYKEFKVLFLNDIEKIIKEYTPNSEIF